MNSVENLQPGRRRVVGVAIALLVVTTLAAVGVMRWMRRAPTALPNAPVAQLPTGAANWSRANFSAAAGEGVRQTSDNSWSVKGGRAFLNVRRKDDASLELRFVYPFDGGLLPKETVMFVRLRWGQSEVAKLADSLNITSEQLETLKAVSPATDIPVSRDDKNHLRALFEDYLAKQDATTEKALVDAMAGIDQNYYDKTRERIDNIADSVKRIFDENQLAALSDRFGPRNR